MGLLPFTPDAEVLLDYIPLSSRQPLVPITEQQPLFMCLCLLRQAGIFPFTFPVARGNTQFKQIAPAKLVQGQLQRIHMHTKTHRHAGLLTALPRGLAGQKAQAASSAESSWSALWHKPSSRQSASSGSCLAAKSLAMKLLSNTKMI